MGSKTPPIFSFFSPVFHCFSPDVWWNPWGRKFNFHEFPWGGKFEFHEFSWGRKFTFHEFPWGGKFQFSSSKFHHNDLPLGGKFFLSASKFLVSVSKLGCLSIKVGGPWRLFPGGTQHLRIVNSLSGLKKEYYFQVRVEFS